ncbi:NAD(P)/FAD-dependent oxidoreductase [Curtobacterium sp. MCPF17_021]|uniref:FAD-dependent oxidoreductase n=1 Tax=Curtobacterium sp. MCPF17_021 TaxID=2175639 RepID=UPI000DA948DB|nr:NAD(P)/FAD-dependent oxidoreductase [Curtobacterium sp. MCPF17_021]WIE83707.1 NAD(P)/FAD-dependent oxidoreductase [Curtobacterium sp. MCPF17_021]
MKALIVGGGIAGLAAAIALHRAGHGSIVLERNAGSADDAGSWLQVASNGVGALHALGLGSAVPTLGVRSSWLQTFDSRGRRTAELPLGPQDEATATRSVKRADLYRLLRTDAERRGVTIITGTRVLSAADEGCQASVLTERHGRFTADIVIGADGIGSAVRRTLGSHGPDASRVTKKDVLAPVVSIGGTYTGSGLPETETGVTGALQFRFGRDCFLGTVRVDTSTVLWFANPRLRAVDGGERAAVSLSGPEWAVVLPRLVGRDALPVSALLAGSGDVDAWTSRTTPRPVLWGQGRIVLIGDAAHAIPPTAGQGASLALEDAVVLGSLAAGGVSATNLAVHLRDRRDRRVAAITRQGVRLDESKTLGPVGSLLRDRIILPGAAFKARMDHADAGGWMYRFTPAT